MLYWYEKGRIFSDRCDHITCSVFKGVTACFINMCGLKNRVKTLHRPLHFSTDSYLIDTGTSIYPQCTEHKWAMLNERYLYFQDERAKLNSDERLHFLTDFYLIDTAASICPQCTEHKWTTHIECRLLVPLTFYRGAAYVLMSILHFSTNSYPDTERSMYEQCVQSIRY